jgi:hypothetical protein
MAAPIHISASGAPIPTCRPNLMPFNIDFTGAAPISTYFRVKPATPQLPNAPSSSSSELPPPVAESTSRMDTDEPVHEASIRLACEVVAGSSSQNAGPQPERQRYTAAFRGRAVQGLEVELPAGYGGIVFNDASASAGPSQRPKSTTFAKKPAPSAKSRRRPSRQASAMEVDDDPLDGDADDIGGAQPNGCIEPKMLVPSAQFSSFVLWNPDIPVDEGQDEYLRSLKEWVALTHEVCGSLRHFETEYNVSLQIHQWEDS